MTVRTEDLLMNPAHHSVPTLIPSAVRAMQATPVLQRASSVQDGPASLSGWPLAASLMSGIYATTWRNGEAAPYLSTILV